MTTLVKQFAGMEFIAFGDAVIICVEIFHGSPKSYRRVNGDTIMGSTSVEKQACRLCRTPIPLASGPPSEKKLVIGPTVRISTVLCSSGSIRLPPIAFELISIAGPRNFCRDSIRSDFVVRIIRQTFL